MKKIFLSIFIIIFLPCLGLVVYLDSTPPPSLWKGLDFSVLILDRDENLMRMALTKDEKYRQHVELKNIPLSVQKATLLYEDQYFYSHPGVNPLAVLRAMLSTLTGSRRIGASTIAMQVARLRYKLVTSSVRGKFKQMLLALQLIWHYGHDNVLEAYYNLAPYGGNIEGIGAASRIYFQTPVENLGISQAIALSLIPQNPKNRVFKSLEKGWLAPNTDFDKARSILHANWNKTYPNEKISEKAPPLRVYSTKDLPLTALHLTTEILQNKDNYSQKIIQTQINSQSQNLLEQNINQFIAHNAFYGINNSAAMLVHWPSMQVHALVGSADFFSESIDGQVDGTRAKRSPGSTLKPLIYALAMDQGLIHTQTMLMDAPKSFTEYNPENFDKQFLGVLPAHEALRLSRNVPAIWLAANLKPSLYDTLKKAKVDLPYGFNYYGLSLVLGGAELTMRELVMLYATLANGGVWQSLQFVKNSNSPDYIPIVSPEAGLATLYMLEESNIKNPNSRKLPWRYKTGTSNGFRDAWTIGIVGPYVLAVWLGNFDNTSNPMLIGGMVAAPLYEQIASSLEFTYKLEDILAEKYLETSLIQIPSCRDTGDVQNNLCKEKVPTWFIPGQSPIKDSNVYRKIWLDKDSGLRLCEPSENAKEVVWEFWPSELYQLFSEAGYHKPLPPDFLEPCKEIVDTSENSIQIQSPRAGLVYHLGSNLQNTLPLSATTTAHAKTLFWFVNEEFVGSSDPKKSFLWEMKVGTHIIQVVDDLGQSQNLKIKIEQRY